MDKIVDREKIPAFFHLWGKAEKTWHPSIHLLIYHLIDVGECTLALWNHSLSIQTRKALSNGLNLDMESAGSTVAFWASLHDLGKASPGFQRKYEPQVAILEKAGFTFPIRSAMPAFPALHGVVSAWALVKLLETKTRMTERDAKRLAKAIGGHHGTWPTADRLQPPALETADKGDTTWEAAREQIFITLQQIYKPGESINFPKKPDESNTFLTLLSGLISVADWIGSMEEHFPFEDEYISPNEYAQRCSRQALTALKELGWIGWQAEGDRLSFEAMFQATPFPNETQKQTFTASLECDLPALIILEAPTGIGKTEAALYVADTWLQRQRGSGLYIAMPTQATSNQMYGRVIRYLESRYPEQSINIHLVHGGALLADDGKQRSPHGISIDNPAAEATVRAESWFLPRKRTLLAPFGVGTVDQALMSVLQTRHFFVRLFGLGQKVIIFDEIHAYDTYMSELFQRLLGWLRSIGTSAILLSATLPEKTRRALAAAWVGQPEEGFVLPETQYPRLTLVESTKVATSVPLPPPSSRLLKLDWIQPTPDQIAFHLAERLLEGGCVAIICNRVQRAQEIYAALKNVVESDCLILFHGRFPFAWRKEIEEKILALFSKNGNRPRKFVVVATQVIEQSLDIDFDYMISDLAPVDLLLQRAGRLHRHKINEENRPPNFDHPRLAIARPPTQDEIPDFGLDTLIYDEVTLLRTWLTLFNREEVILPQDTGPLIETVYPLDTNDHQYNPKYQKLLQMKTDKANLERGKEIHEARQRLIARPDYEDLLSQRNDELEEDDAKAGQAFRALTRLGEPSISLVCLYQMASVIGFDLDSSGDGIDLCQKPSPTLTRKLLQNSVNVQRKDVVNYFINHDSRTAGWKKSAALRDYYPVIFDAEGFYRPEGGGFVLKLSREFGLEVLKAEG